MPPSSEHRQTSGDGILAADSRSAGQLPGAGHGGAARRWARRARPARSMLAGSMLAVGLAACGGPATFVELGGIDGGLHTPQEVAAGQLHVLVFTSQECPIANAYAPTIGALAAEWLDQPVRLYVVHMDPDLAVDAARAHRREYELPGTILLDPGQWLAEALGVTRTPEAVVLSEAGLLYRGRIDNQWPDLGVRTPVATVHDLRDAVETARGGGTVPLPHPPAVGCLLPEPAR